MDTSRPHTVNDHARLGQIIAAWKAALGGGLRISEATLYNWKAKYGAMTVSEARRLKVLEEENRKLKKLLAEAHLDMAALKDIASGKF